LTIQILLVLAVMLVTLVLLSLDLFSPDVIALGLIAVLVLLGLVPLERALSGLGSEVFILLLGLLVMTAALEKNGAVHWLHRVLASRVDGSANRLISIIIIAATGLSAIMSNTGATAFLLPIAIGAARNTKISRSKILLPMAFASILASSLTLVATSTNIIIDGLLIDEGFTGLGMFELTPVGLIIALVGIVYLLTIGKKLTPDRPYAEEFSLEAGVRNYLTEVTIPVDSDLAGKSLKQAALGRDLDLTVVRISKNKKNFLIPTANTVLDAGDVLIVEGDRDQLLRMDLSADLQLKPRSEIPKNAFQSDQIGLFEVILLPRSSFVGKTLKQLDFRRQYQLQVLGINRGGKTMKKKLSEVPLRVGDQLLIHGSRPSAMMLDQSNTLRLLHVMQEDVNSRSKALLSASVFLGVLLMSGLNLFSVPMAALLGMVTIFLTGCLRTEEAYQMVNWHALIMVGGMLAMGVALQETGAAAFLSTQIVALTYGMDAKWLLAGFFLLSTLLSQPMSNQAAAVVVVPIALQTAVQLGLNPRSFAVMIAIGASCSFLTPLEPSCVMVYGPGNYRFRDFLKVGFPLTILIFLIAIYFVPLWWPL